MEIAALISILLPIISGSLSVAGIIPAGAMPLITASGAALSTLLTQFLAGKVTADSVALAALQAVQSEVTALKTSGVLFTLNQANEINAIAAAITDALMAYKNSLVTTDPSNLTPLPTEL